MKCFHCNAETVTEQHGPKFFVMCKNTSSPCGVRGVGRPLSNGKDTAQEAEQEYAQELERMAKFDEAMGQ